jgi:rare lipoprotein A
MIKQNDLLNFYRTNARMPGRARIWLVPALVLLTACVPTRWEKESERSSEPEPVTQTKKRSSRGNPPFYEVFGQRYYVMESSYGYKERGVASWYGKKFHGKPTSSGEIYNMHAMTAAHKTLPLPTDVRVTNLSNGNSVVVRVNDRGPFVGNRIIDLSYTAASQLDMITNGTAMVQVETVQHGYRPEPVVADAQEKPAGASVINPIGSAAAAPAPKAESASLFLQIGAFGERSNAQLLQQQLKTSGIQNVVIHYDDDSDASLYRVRLGPIANVNEYDALVERMASMQISDTHLVIEKSRDISSTDNQALPGS